MDDPEPITLTPLEVVELEALLEPFCPQANEGHYRPDACLPWCTVCRDLIIHRQEV